MACEACRASKIKCLPSEQFATCKSCLQARKECIPQTTRRSRQHLQRRHDQPRQTQDSQQITKFSLNFQVQEQQNENDFTAVVKNHSKAFETLFAFDDSQSPSSTGQVSFQSSATSSTNTFTSIQTFSKTPQFHLSSAEFLLASFQPMLVHFPCTLLPSNLSVAKLAASRPFVLLAILSAASGSRSIQGNKLYEEEFRRVLALKFTASGERSLELLQAILIYCAWYPFHLKPNRTQIQQFVHYVRVAAEIVQDLQLEEITKVVELSQIQKVRDEQLEQIRAYLCFCYLISSAMFSWKRPQALAANWTPHTITCCSILESNAQWEGDFILPPLIRFAAVLNDAIEYAANPYSHFAERNQDVWAGLKAQVTNIQCQLHPDIVTKVPVKIASLFSSIFLAGGPTMKFPGATAPPGQKPDYLFPSPFDLASCAEHIDKMFEYINSLDRSSYALFSGIEWTRLIATIIMAIRLSFAVPQCPEWDTSWSRSRIRLREFIICFSRFYNDGSSESHKYSLDVYSASCIIMSMVKDKYEQRVSMEETILQNLAPMAQPTTATAPSLGCPMLDGSAAQYIPMWDGTAMQFASTTHPAPTAMHNGAGLGEIKNNYPQNEAQDYWGTIVTDWAEK